VRFVTETSEKTYKGIAMEGYFAKWYAKATKKDMKGYTDTAKIVVGAGKLKGGEIILEVAPGPGYLSIELCKLGNFKVYGLDISKTFVKIAQENALKEGVIVDFRLGDATNMPFDNDSFDLIVNQSAFKNFTKPVVALNEMYRVLKRGGKSVIFDLRPDASDDVISDYVKNMHLNKIDSLMTKLSLRRLRNLVIMKFRKILWA
jgi:ubiquinone/menaquinone biosynthesis C-methylase UbiE